MNVDILIKTIKSQLNNSSAVNVQDVQKGTRKLTGMHSLYISLANIIASLSGVRYMNEKTNMVIAVVDEDDEV